MSGMNNEGRRRFPDWIPEANRERNAENDAKFRYAPWDADDLDRNDPDPEVRAFIAHMDRTTRIHNALTFEGQMTLLETASVSPHHSPVKIWAIRAVGFFILVGFALAFLARLY
ncbi:hypothetical protein EH165_05615 [Nakamurella antarctica]|uniref:Uncharacterized protein n=1 Tax=Nakamurella antarctica TaxID=1902245 RepID=A0A3G8ZTA2_9ACTN|nr:hypothetical protein [Nakamurella antarctica]AZI57704.1 hypothetical protein EH165_05615 [Nakamurella antarctica]